MEKTVVTIEQLHSEENLSNVNDVHMDTDNNTQSHQFRSKYRTWKGVGVFSLFTILSMIVAILVVSFTISYKSKITCEVIIKTINYQFISSNSYPKCIVTYDFNRDKQMDIAVANSGTNNIGIFFGMGNGTFTTQMTYSTGIGSQPSSIAVADLNKDGYLDIVVSNFGSHTIGILIGNHNGTFQDQIVYSVGSSRPLRVALNDLNNDSYIDIVVTNYGTNIVGILFGYDNGLLQNQIQLSSTYDSIPLSIAIKDFNNDNNLDIAVVNSGLHNIEFYFGNGNGTFTDRIIISTGIGSYPNDIDVADFNQDNYLDIVIVNLALNNICIFFGNAKGTFTEQRTYSTGNNSKPISIIIDDFNHDDQLDIVVSNSGTNNVGVFLGLGNGLFKDQVIFSTGSNSQPYSIVGADFNNDQRLDIAVANYARNNIFILLAYSNATFSDQKIYSTGSESQPSSVDMGHFNNDSKLDIVVVDIDSGSVGVFMGNGDGTFSNQSIYLVIDEPWSIVTGVGDFNRDGFDDIVIFYQNYDGNKMEIHRGNSFGTFTFLTTLNYDFYDELQSIIICDLNNDTYLDISFMCDYSSVICAFLGYGNGSFTDVFQSTIRYSASGFTVTDFNNDGRPDVAVTYKSDPYPYGSVGILYGDGAGHFVNERSYSTGYYPLTSSVASSDFNSDGQIDLVVSNPWNSNIGILFGYGNGTFLPQKIYATGYESHPSFVIVGDFNNDSLVDILFDHQERRGIALFLGYGNGSFSNAVIYSSSKNSRPTSAAIGDFNHDTLLDVIVINSEDKNFGVFLGFANANFMQGTPLSTGSSSGPRSIFVDDFNEDHQMDFVVANYITNNIGIYLGNGQGEFPVQDQYSTGSISSPVAVSVHDFNNDNHRDIAVVNSGVNSFGIFYGYGNGSFGKQNSYSISDGLNPYSIDTGDYNNDHLTDIVIANYGNDNINILIQYDYGYFGSRTPYSTGAGSNPFKFAIGDFDNDNRLDIVTANNGDHTIRIFFGNGDGTFSNQIIYSPDDKCLPTSVDAGDFNDDNIADIALIDNAHFLLYILIMGANRTISHTIVYNTQSNGWPREVTVGYLNDDSRPDLVVANFETGTINIFLGIGNGEFSVTIDYPISARDGLSSAVIADFDNDNRSDVAVVYERGDVINIMFGNGDGSFSKQKLLSTGSGSASTSITVGDFDKDGYIDIVIAKSALSSIGIFFGYGNGSFEDQIILSTGQDSQTSSLTVIDLNHDGIDDIAVVNSQKSEIGFFLGYVNRTFFSQITYSTGYNARPTGVLFADFNNNSRLDMAVCNSDNDDISIFLGYSGKSFISLPSYSTGLNSRPMFVATGDFDNNKQLDVAVTNSGTNNLMILFGSGYGTFIRENIYLTGNDSHPSSIAIADLNDDNQLDIVVSNSGSDNIGIFIGKTNGTFYNQIIYSTGLKSQPSSVNIADYNNDTLLDIAVANYGSNNVGFFFGYGNGSFSNQFILPIGFNARPFALSSKDINHDNVTDVIIGNYAYGNTNIVMKLC